MKIKPDVKYIFAFLIVFVIEVIIAVFVHDYFIRPYLGDVLVVVLIYCMVRAFVQYNGKRLPLYIFVFAVTVEIGQYFNLAEWLDLGDYALARVIIGSTFDMMDIACYFAGCALLFLFESPKRKVIRTITYK